MFLRRKRTLVFETLLKRLPRPVRVLDVGGEMGFWNILDHGCHGQIQVTLLNLFEQTDLPPNPRTTIRIHHELFY